ncbi:hypothetical protein NLJ89_g9289 [Agrocybe chaxingu]|uniref:Uncharacterized protein n=1 Tax=Agrocybe chaxingu TaxID=84603 RepID=A0A9W8JR29_9AGAR|nr:hypothetical protein NLJ89_g9289 [Agrocybe chaxingu]
MTPAPAAEDIGNDTSQAQQAEKTRLPGFGLPVNYHPVGDSFPTAISRSPEEDCRRRILPLITLRELEMLRIMNEITDKTDWHIKKTEAIAAKGRDITLRMMDWVIDELRYKAEVFGRTGAVSVYTGDVVKSDSALSESFRLKLQRAAKALEGVPEKHKDWHPGPKNTVLDLDHPSLFPLVYGRSRILERGRTALYDALKEYYSCTTSGGDDGLR